MTVNRDRIAAWFEATGFAVQALRIRRNESPELDHPPVANRRQHSGQHRSHLIDGLRPRLAVLAGTNQQRVGPKRRRDPVATQPLRGRLSRPLNRSLGVKAE
jgi:hypothetical protein